MARIPLIQQKEDLAPEHRPIFDGIAQSRGSVRGPFGVLLHSPEIAGRTAHLGAYIRFESLLDRKLAELAVLAAARESNCRYEWAAHIALARQVGVREEAIAAIRNKEAPKGLTAEEAQVVSYVQQLLRSHRVSEATFHALRERLGTQSLVELTATVGYYGMIACALNAFEVEPPAGGDVLPD